MSERAAVRTGSRWLLVAALFGAIAVPSAASAQAFLGQYAATLSSRIEPTRDVFRGNAATRTGERLIAAGARMAERSVGPALTGHALRAAGRNIASGVMTGTGRVIRGAGGRAFNTRERISTRANRIAFVARSHGRATSNWTGRELRNVGRFLAGSNRLENPRRAAVRIDAGRPRQNIYYRTRNAGSGELRSTQMIYRSGSASFGRLEAARMVNRHPHHAPNTTLVSTYTFSPRR